MSTRVLPHHAEAEASVLGGVFLRSEVIHDVPDLAVEHFYDHRHRVVFEAMRNLENQSRPIDLVTVEGEIAKAGKLDAIGGIAYLGELTLRVPTVDNVVEYARIVVELAQARAMMLAASEIAEQGYDRHIDVREYLDGAEARVLSLAARRGGEDDALPIGEHVARRYREFDRIARSRAQGETALTGCPTGIVDLDSKLGGWQFGVINLLAARPAMGKSATALAGADATSHHGWGVHVFSLEDSARAYSDRCIARRTGIPVERVRQADFSRQDASLVAQAAVELRQRNDRWHLDERGGLSAADIVRAVRRRKRKLRTRLVIVDYVQLVRRTPRLDENAAIEEIMTTFATAAKDDGGDVAWLVLSQLNRKAEDRIDKRPQMADLRGSGALEERCKVMVGQYRGAYYSSEPRKDIDYDCTCAPKVPTSACPHRPDEVQFETQAQLLLLKNNNGQTGRIFAHWHGPTVEIR